MRWFNSQRTNSSTRHRAISECLIRSIPPEFNVPHEDDHPLFIQVDFGLVRDASGQLAPKLVELQGFPSLYGYQAMLSQAYIDVFDLDDNLQYLLSDLDWDSYQRLCGGLSWATMIQKMWF